MSRRVTVFQTGRAILTKLQSMILQPAVITTSCVSECYLISFHMLLTWLSLSGSKAVAAKCFIGILKNSAEFTGKQLCWNHFFNRIPSQFLSQNDTPTQMSSCEFCKIFKNICSYRAPLVAVSVDLRKQMWFLMKTNFSSTFIKFSGRV